MGQLVEALDDGDWSVRKFASKALGEIGNNSAVDPLIDTLTDEDWGVRVAAVKALGDIGDEKGIDPIKKLVGLLLVIKNLKKHATRL